MIEPKTKVIFRKWKDTGDIIAIFPELPGDINPITCLSYMTIGQHSACDPYYLIQDATKPVSPKEYLSLANELSRIGYELEIIHRNRYSFYFTRRNAL